MAVKTKTFTAAAWIILLLIGMLQIYPGFSAYAEEGDSGIPGDYSQYVSMSEATPYPEPEVITLPSEEPEFFEMEPPELTEEEKAELERERLEAENTVIINNMDDFNVFASNCIDKMWSVGKKVYMETDLDFNNEPFTPVSYFAGEFYGNQHVVSGLNISGNYARAGFFATLAKSAYITQLKVKGTVRGTGKAIVGGIAGENYGTLQNVIFQGNVSSEYSAGGIAGLNLENAYITDSKSGGTVTAPTCAGGIAADNRGKVISCENHSVVSTGTTGINRIFERKDHIGAITGFSSGREEECVNLSAVSGSAFTIEKQKLFFTGLVIFGVAFMSGAVTLIVLLLNDGKKNR